MRRATHIKKNLVKDFVPEGKRNTSKSWRLTDYWEKRGYWIHRTTNKNGTPDGWQLLRGNSSFYHMNTVRWCRSLNDLDQYLNYLERQATINRQKAIGETV